MTRATRSRWRSSDVSTPAGITRCMRTAETSREGGGEGSSTRRWVWTGLAVVLAGGLALRLWGVRQGLPFAYNTDEADHFVTRAVNMFAAGSPNPHYLPP